MKFIYRLLFILGITIIGVPIAILIYIVMIFSPIYWVITGKNMYNTMDNLLSIAIGYLYDVYKKII